jgi:hypothetical protein
MPEPVTIVLVGAAAWAWLKGKQNVQAGQVLPGAPGTTVVPGTITPAGTPVPNPTGAPPPNVEQPPSVAGSGTGPTAPLATNTGNSNGVPIAQAADPNANITAIPADLVAILDDQSALMFREYVALHPDQFQVFLDRYAKNIELRDDMFFHAITDPPQGGYQLTPDMAVGLGTAAYKVVQGLNGVAAGNYGDLFGVSATVAGKIPGLDPNFVKAMQGIALGYRAFTQLTTLADIQAIATANGVGILDVTSSMLTSGAAGVYDAAGNLVSVAETPLVGGAFAGAPIASLGGALMAVGLVLDIGFTIAGDAPDVQKAIDVALDVASLVCLFIPVIGWIIAIVIQVVKFIIDLFGGDLFGGGLSHEQREMLETARYSENISPMFPQLAGSYTPRELFRTCADWTSGYCGGKHIVAMGINLILHEGDVIMVGGKPVTVAGDLGTGAPVLLPPGATQTTLGIGDNGPNGGQCYWLQGTPFAAMTNDEIAWAMAKYGAVNGFIAEAQAGIREDLKTQFNVPTQNILMARTQTMKTFIDHGFTLDQIDQVAKEYRAQPHLADLATAYGFPDWQHFFGFIVNDEWVAFSLSTTHGTLHDFALANGFQSLYDFRASALASYDSYFGTAVAAAATIAATQAAAAQTVSTYNAGVLFLQSIGSNAP